MTNEKGNNANDPSVIAAAAAQDFDALVDALEIDPRDWLRRLARQVAETPFPTSEKARRASAILLSNFPAFKSMFFNRNWYGVRRLIDEIQRNIRPLTIPEPPLDFQGQLRTLVSYFQNRSWLSEEIAALGEYFYKPGERISEIRAASVKLGERTILRAEIRQMLASERGGLRRHAVVNGDRREEIAVQRERENEECLARGEEPRHGQL